MAQAVAAANSGSDVCFGATACHWQLEGPPRAAAYQLCCIALCLAKPASICAAAAGRDGCRGARRADATAAAELALRACRTRDSPATALVASGAPQTALAQAAARSRAATGASSFVLADAAATALAALGRQDQAAGLRMSTATPNVIAEADATALVASGAPRPCSQRLLPAVSLNSDLFAQKPRGKRCLRAWRFFSAQGVA